MKKHLSEFLLESIQSALPSSPVLTEIISEATEKGFSIINVKEELFDLCSNDEIQQTWSNWQELSDREEIRLRLQAIYKSDQLHNSLTPFILFFFRASDPVTYQIAARIMGKWIHSNRELQDYLRQYLTQKKIDISKPISLNGQRSLRRLLIVLSEHIAHHGEKLSLTDEEYSLELPIHPHQLSDSAPASQLDRSVIMLAVGLLSKAYQNTLLPGIKALLQFPANIPSGQITWDRNIIRNWGILLAEAPIGSSEKKNIWCDYLQKELTHFKDLTRFSEKLQALFRIDEVIRSSVFSIPDEEKVKPGISDHELSLFCQLRLKHWLHREKGHSSFESSLDNLQNTDSPTFITRHFKTEIKNRFREPESQLPDLLYPLREDSAWRIMPVSDRVYHAFFLLDIATHCQAIPREELRQVLSTISNSLPAVNSSETKTAIALSAILKKLILAEQTAKANIPDGKLIHKITDESLLLDLLPTEIDTWQLPVLADAFENQIRLLLATDHTFNLDHYLYKITVREPNPRFYRFLMELSRERKYKVLSTQNSQFTEKLDFIYQQDLNEQEAVLPVSLNDARFWSALTKVRNRLSGYLAQSDLFELLQSLIHEMDGTGTESLTADSTLHDLVTIVQADDPNWLISGFPSRVIDGRLKSTRQLADLRSQLAINSPNIIPADLSTVSDISETVQRIKYIINQVTDVLNPLLSSPEAALMSRLNVHFYELLTNWSKALEKTSSVLKQAKIEYPSEGNKMWQPVFETAVSEPNKVFQSKLLMLFLSTILGVETSSVQKNWFKRYQVLTWACLSATTGKIDPEIHQFWKSMLRKHWQTMLESAMEERQEARVLQLIRSEELVTLRRSDQLKALITLAKTWCFERYDLNHALVCNQELHPEKNPIQTKVTTLREYFSYFSNVWIALVVGVILMFDFGDPWTELAEIGDFGGVMFTFILGVGGTYLYVYTDLRKKVTFEKGDPVQWASLFGRVGLFLSITLIFTVLIVILFWYMFSSTDQVVHGSNAIWHIMSWTGFALFVGVFFGLIGKG